MGRSTVTQSISRSIFSSGRPFFSYMASRKKGSIMSIITREAALLPTGFFSRKNSGTPVMAAAVKQISCRLVRLNMTLVLTFVRSLGTDT